MIKTDYNAAWSFLLHAGYLKAENMRRENRERLYDLSIPNEEVSEMYVSLLKCYFEEDLKVSLNVKDFLEALLKSDYTNMALILKGMYFKYVSTNDVKINNLGYSEEKERQENFHHGYILGLLMYGVRYYEVYSNREYGYGRPDIVLIPKDKSKTAHVFEFKWSSTKSSKTLEGLMREAKTQIAEKNYASGVKSVHTVEKVVSIAVGFKGKALKLEVNK